MSFVVILKNLARVGVRTILCTVTICRMYMFGAYSFMSSLLAVIEMEITNWRRGLRCSDAHKNPSPGVDDGGGKDGNDSRLTELYKYAIQQILLTSSIIAFFEYILLPINQLIHDRYLPQGVRVEPSSIFPSTISLSRVLFTVLWALPTLAVSKAYSMMLCFELFNQLKERFSSQENRVRRNFSLSGIEASIDFALSFLTQIIFYISIALLQFCFPTRFTTVLANLSVSLLLCLSSFEYTWSPGYEYFARYAIVEDHWPFFAGFGTPVTLLLAVSVSNRLYYNFLYTTLFPIMLATATYHAHLPEMHRVMTSRSMMSPFSVPFFRTSIVITTLAMSSGIVEYLLHLSFGLPTATASPRRLDGTDNCYNMNRDRCNTVADGKLSRLILDTHSIDQQMEAVFADVTSDPRLKNMAGGLRNPQNNASSGRRSMDKFMSLLNHSVIRQRHDPFIMLKDDLTEVSVSASSK